MDKDTTLFSALTLYFAVTYFLNVKPVLLITVLTRASQP